MTTLLIWICCLPSCATQALVLGSHGIMHDLALHLAQEVGKAAGDA